MMKKHGIIYKKEGDIMITSSRLQEKIVEFLSDQNSHSVQEIKAFLARNNISDYTEGQFAGSINTLLRNNSIRKIDRGIYSMKKRSEDMKKCFVVCPVGEENSETRCNADKIFKYIITPVCEACEFYPVRADQLNDANSITQTIIESLDNADLVIADISGHNPNVFYEMGYRARTKKPLIHLKKRGETLPFDITAIRTLEYDLTDLDSVEEIKERLKRTIESFNFSENSITPAPEDASENIPSAVMPLLYQILDVMGELKSEVRSFSTETIGTVIRSMQSQQPQVPSDTALQMQLINSLVQNPESYMKFVEILNRNEKSKALR